jgi:hypothetical protein
MCKMGDVRRDWEDVRGIEGGRPARGSEIVRSDRELKLPNSSFSIFTTNCPRRCWSFRCAHAFVAIFLTLDEPWKRLFLLSVLKTYCGKVAIHKRWVGSSNRCQIPWGCAVWHSTLLEPSQCQNGQLVAELRVQRTVSLCYQYTVHWKSFSIRFVWFREISR